MEIKEIFDRLTRQEYLIKHMLNTHLDTIPIDVQYALIGLRKELKEIRSSIETLKIDTDLNIGDEVIYTEDGEVCKIIETPFVKNNKIYVKVLTKEYGKCTEILNDVVFPYFKERTKE